MLSTTELLSRDELERGLIAAVEAYPFETTRFHRLLATGRAPHAVLLRYARSTWLSASLFCASIAELVDKAPDRDARLTLLENLMEEEGVFLRPSTGLAVRPEQRHPALAMRFVVACGGDAVDDPGKGALHATVAGRAWLAEGRWLEALAFLLIGQELKFAKVSGQIFDLLAPLGFADRDLAFFAVHKEADCRHGREALDLVLDRALTVADQQAALAAAEAGARSWFEMHGGRAGGRAA